jgi:hypothetical protein
VAKISAEKLKRDRGKMKLAGLICGRIFPKLAEKKFSKEVPYLTVLTNTLKRTKKCCFILM